MEYSNEQECIIEADDPEGGWVDTHHYATSVAGLDEKVTEMALEETLGEPSQLQDNADEDEDDEDAADMEAFEISGMLDEQDKVTQTYLPEKKNSPELIIVENNFPCSTRQRKALRKLATRNGTHLRRERSFALAPMTCTLHTINIIKLLDYGCLDTTR